MFHIKLLARPDGRMVEVPLELSADLPREFEGVAVLVSSGLPRKVRLKAGPDLIKLSTAYRADRLIGDIVRATFKASPQDVARFTEAAAAFVARVRERRTEGASISIENNGRGKLELVETNSPSGGRAGSAQAGGQAGGQVPGGSSPDLPAPLAPAPPGATSTPPASERLLTMERRLLDLEAKMGALLSAPAKESPDPQLARRLEQLARVDERLGALATLLRRVDQLEARGADQAAQPGRPPPDPGMPARSPSSAVLEAAAAPQSKGLLRRATALDAFAEGWRRDLKACADVLTVDAVKVSAAIDKMVLLAGEGERELGGQPGGADLLRNLAQEAASRAVGLRRFGEEVEFYSLAELPIAKTLLDRLSAPLTTDGAEAILRERALAMIGHARQRPVAVWLSRVAPLIGWKLLWVSPGDPIDRTAHEVVGNGEIVSELLAPGICGADGARLTKPLVLGNEDKDTARRELAGPIGGHAAPLTLGSVLVVDAGTDAPAADERELASAEAGRQGVRSHPVLGPLPPAQAATDFAITPAPTTLAPAHEPAIAAAPAEVLAVFAPPPPPPSAAAHPVLAAIVPPPPEPAGAAPEPAPEPKPAPQPSPQPPPQQASGEIVFEAPQQPLPESAPSAAAPAPRPPPPPPTTHAVMQALGLDPLSDLFDPPATSNAKRTSSPGAADDGPIELAEGDLELVELVELPKPGDQKL